VEFGSGCLGGCIIFSKDARDGCSSALTHTLIVCKASVEIRSVSCSLKKIRIEKSQEVTEECQDRDQRIMIWIALTEAPCCGSGSGTSAF
jgi:hypothetical protein